MTNPCSMSSTRSADAIQQGAAPAAPAQARQLSLVLSLYAHVNACPSLEFRFPKDHGINTPNPALTGKTNFAITVPCEIYVLALLVLIG